jgi:hypothetical protein
MFNFNEQPVGDEAFVGPTRGEPVHPSRVILFCEGSEDDNVLSGIPLLEAGYNKGLDLEKISGGGAEGFLKNASGRSRSSSAKKPTWPRWPIRRRRLVMPTSAKRWATRSTSLTAAPMRRRSCRPGRCTF